MQAIKLKRKNKTNLDVEKEFCIPYSHIVRELWAHKELLKDSGFEKELIKKHKLEYWSKFFHGCKTDVEAKISLCEVQQKNKLEKLEYLEKQLEIFLKNDKSKINSSNIFWSRYKILEIKKSIGRDITFGSRELLQRISFLSNPISKKVRKKITEEEFKKKDEERLSKLKEAKEEYQKRRILMLYSIGEENYKNYNSNRKYEFDLCNRTVIFKPKNKTRIPIEFYCSNNQYKILCQLQEKIPDLPISVRLNNDYVCLTFDEQKLNGYHFNKKEYKSEKRLVSENKELKNTCYKKWKREQEKRMAIGKIENRFISFDLNPEFIGFVVFDYIDGEMKLIHKECISFQNLNTKLYLSSFDKKQIKQNKKRIHELYQVWKYIFNLAKHYKVSNCAIEDLQFKANGLNMEAREANRKTKNIWHRTKTVCVINKYCNTLGIKIIEDINPAYSSFVGNIRYNYFDPINASIEVGRRGSTKYLKGSKLLPPLERSDLDTMYQLGLDVQDKTISTFAKAYKLFQKSKLRYRRKLDQTSFLESNLYSKKSKVKKYSFS